MGILIDVSGTTYLLPLTGDSIQHTPDTVIRYAGSGVGDSESPRTLQEFRRDQVLGMVPPAPAYTTIQKLVECLPGFNRETVRRILVRLEQDGQIRSSRPQSKQRGRVARRWTSNIYKQG